MIRKYRLLPVIFIATILMYTIFLLMAEETVKFKDNLNLKEFNEGYAYYTPYPNGQRWEIGKLFIDVQSLSPEHNLIFLGASTTRMGIIPDQLKIPPKWKLTNMGQGADTIDSIKIMRNYINSYANHKPDKTDLIVIDVFYATFARRPFRDFQWIQVLEGFGPYHVDDSLHVHGAEPKIVTQLKLGSYTMRLALDMYIAPPGESIFTAVTGFIQESLSSIGDKREVITPINLTPEKLAEMRAHWISWTGNTTYPGQSTDDFKELLKELKSQTNVAVVNLYIPSWHTAYPVEQEYEKWVDNDLIPFLKHEGIPLMDFSASIPDSQYGDTAHLSKKGRETYTQEYNKAINPILFEISP